MVPTQKEMKKNDRRVVTGPCEFHENVQKYSILTKFFSNENPVLAMMVSRAVRQLPDTVRQEILDL